VPRPNPLRTLQSESTLAERIGYERQVRSWSYEETARRVSEAGCAMQMTAVYKIEEARPRRRITVNELVGFSTIFGINVEELLLPVEIAQSNEARRLLEWARLAADAVTAAADEYRASVAAFLAFGEGTPWAQALANSDVADDALRP